jgi:hypothetical protein
MVDKGALEQLLRALDRSGPDLNELRVTRHPILEKRKGWKNPINQLVDDYNAYVEAYNERLDAGKLDDLTISDVVELLEDGWTWIKNTRCKYVTMTFDTRNGAVSTILDRDGHSIPHTEFKRQHSKAHD